MKLFILAVGNRMPSWVEAGFEEYRKRLPEMSLREIRPEKRSSGKTREQILKIEGERIEESIPRNCLRVVLDETGKLFRTSELAEKLKSWMNEGKDLAFVIGGADGIDGKIKDSADLLFSLSPLTLPHGLARVLLAEQLYRAHSLINHHPYHREG